jgi:hypothetical protein
MSEDTCAAKRLDLSVEPRHLIAERRQFMAEYRYHIPEHRYLTNEHGYFTAKSRQHAAYPLPSHSRLRPFGSATH